MKEEKEIKTEDPQTEVLTEPIVEETKIEASAVYDDVVKVVARDLIKAGADLAVGYDKKLSEVLEDIATKVNSVIE